MIRRCLLPLAALLALAACATGPGPARMTLAATDTPQWDWQLQDPKLRPRSDVMDLDPDEVTRRQVRRLGAQGTTTIAYVSVGTRERWRGDRDAFPASVVGRAYDGWAGERFLDIRKVERLRPIMRARFERAARMGFDAIEPDNMDVHVNDSGFAVRPRHTVRYMRAMAGEAQALGLEIGQKNAPELVPRLVDTLDFMVTEDCFADGWCRKTLPYIRAGKPVYAAEYTDTGVNMRRACRFAARHGITMSQFDRDLSGPAIRQC